MGEDSIVGGNFSNKAKRRGNGRILTTRLHLVAIVVAVAAIIAHEDRLYAFAVVAPEHVIPAAVACNRKRREHKKGIGEKRARDIHCRDR